MFVDILKSIFESFHPPFTGVIHDAEELFKSLPQHEEFAAGPTSITWTAKTSYKTFPKRDQDGSSSCVIQGLAKAGGVTVANQGGEFPILSALPYNKRSNFPDPGTIPANGLAIAADGLPLERLYPSQKMSEEAMNAAPKLPTDPRYAGVPVILPVDIDAIAAAVDQGYGVVICNRFASAEYEAYIPRTIMGVVRSIGHLIAVVDRTIIKGQKALVCEDSAFLKTADPAGQRIITEEFLRSHTFFAGYVRIIKTPTSTGVSKPVHTFLTNLTIGNRGNEVMILQQRMVFEGLLSPDCMTGYFGNLTKNAVIAYQAANGLPQTGYVGPMTREILNSNY